jgi:hypothetical protein
MFNLTRYLYDKQEVEYSFLISLLSKKESSFFWGYELFHSGFTSDMKKLLYKIYYTFYSATNLNLEQFMVNEIGKLNNINLYIIIDNLISINWTDDILFAKKPIKNFNIVNSLKKKEYNKVLSSIIFHYDEEYINHIFNHFDKKYDIEIKKFTKYNNKNIISPNIKLAAFLLRYRFISENKKLGKNIVINSNDESYKKYDTLFTDHSSDDKYPFLSKLPARNILSSVNLYEIEDDISLFNLNGEHADLKNAYYYHWEYNCYDTPIWRDRFDKFNIIIDDEIQTIEFEYDDESELFYKDFGYEPDEQSLNVQKKCIKDINIIDFNSNQGYKSILFNKQLYEKIKF